MMHSYKFNLNTKGIEIKVLILVVMDDALVQTYKGTTDNILLS